MKENSVAEYLQARLGQELSREENSHCRQLFADAFTATAGIADPEKLVYPYDYSQADQRVNRTLYHESRRRNIDCARAMEAAISGSNYKLHHYNLDIAAMVVLQQYGFPRVNAVLAHCIRRQSWDGRYSDENKQWAGAFDLSERAFEQVHMDTHPILIDGFANHVRELHDELDAGRFALPGQPESGEEVERYAITRAVVFDDHRGFAIAKHPTAGCVCWQFNEKDGKRDYYWGHYCTDEKSAADNFTARIAAYMSNGAKDAQRSATALRQQKSKDRSER